MGSTPVVSLVVMGVSGSGKTTVATEVARRLGWEFTEGDDHHPPANVEKMRAGHPLDDGDRRPWLEELARWIGAHEADGRSCVLTCSALKRSYRDILRDGHPSVWFAHVSGPQELITDRVSHRQGHYMPATLVPSQFAILEPLADDEPGRVVPAVGSPEQVVDELLADLQRDFGVEELPSQP
jgi:gluconokinase